MEPSRRVGVPILRAREESIYAEYEPVIGKELLEALRALDR